MATFKVMVRKDRRKVDKSYVVYIRFTHNRRTTYLPTSMVAERGDLTSSLKIKNWRILDRGEELIRVYRKKIEGLYLEINDVPWERIVDTLKRKGETEVIRKMIVVELVSGSRAEMARDCFLMSFCLMGMNAVDLYGVREYDGRSLTYNRTKTRDRRRMTVRVR